MGESGPPCGVPGVEKRPDEFEQTLIEHSRGDARHQAIVTDSVEELFEIEIDHDVVAVGDVTLRLSHCLMGGAPRSKAVTVLGKRRAPPLLENLPTAWPNSKRPLERTRRSGASAAAFVFLS